MTEPFVIAAGDRLPVITSTLAGADGAAIDLTGASVELRLWNWTLSTVVARYAAENLDTGPTTRGQVRYRWGTGMTGDTAVPGWYKARWLVTFADGNRLSFPNEGHQTVAVSP